MAVGVSTDSIHPHTSQHRSCHHAIVAAWRSQSVDTRLALFDGGSGATNNSGREQRRGAMGRSEAVEVSGDGRGSMHTVRLALKI